MSESSLYPLRFEPSFQYRLWGGRALGAWLNTPLPGDDPVGEAWVLSDRDDHSSCVANGPLKGHNLTQLMRQSRDQLLGGLATRFERFPLLLKFLDVRDMLSVQVHPSDNQTDLLPAGERGKTEAWVVLEAAPNGRIYAGLKPHTTASDLRTLTARTAEEQLPCFRPEAGQGVLIEAGTVHTLGGGVMVFEVQENSDVTFRLYDWDRVDPKTGKPRALQVEQALACIDLAQGPISPVRPAVETAGPVKRETLFDNSHFHLQRVEASAPFDVGAQGKPRVLVQIEGEGAIEYGGSDYPLDRGAVMLLPASVGASRLRPHGRCTLLEIAIPEAP
jgi:mannose-6-phosphate isomerase